MKTVTTYDIIITNISEVHGEYPGEVDVKFHREGGDFPPGHRDGFETICVALSAKIINADGSVNQEQVYAEVESKVGRTEEVVIETENQ